MSGPTASRCARGTRLTGGTVHAQHDHRLAMAFAIAALGATGPTHDRGRRRGGGVVSRVLRGPRSARRSAGEASRAREDRQDLPGRLHGRRQDRPWRARSASGSTGRSKTSTPASSAPSAATSRPSSAQDGEPYFRAREREALIGLLPERGAVVASGGGTFADASNRELMLRDGGGGLAGCPVRNGAAAHAPSMAGGRWLLIGWEWNSFIISASRPTARRTSGWTQDAAPSRSSSITSWSGWIPDSLHALPGYQRYSRNLEAYRDGHGRGRQAAGLRQGAACSATSSATAPIPTPFASGCATLKPDALIRGNHDKVGSGVESPEGFNAVARNAIRWTYDNAEQGEPRLAGGPAGGPDDRRRHDRDLPRHAVRRRRLRVRRSRRAARHACGAAAALPVRPHARAGRPLPVTRSVRPRDRRRSRGRCRFRSTSEPLPGQPGIGRTAARRRSARRLRHRRHRRRAR